VWIGAAPARKSDILLERQERLEYDTPQEEGMGGPGDLGVGIDLVSIGRIERMVGRWGRRFLERVFTRDEIEYCDSRYAPAGSLAARFAAKEAFIKAVSGARPGGIRYRDVEVVVNDSGVPGLRPRGTAKAALDGSYARLSLSHEGDLAIAIVITCPEVQR
jgi:holo-[acyl-carrier protein] synthase